jgi:hypothetical protein
MHVKFDNSTAIYKYLKNLTPWRDSKPGSSVLWADAMTTMPRHQGNVTEFYPFIKTPFFGPDVAYRNCRECKFFMT